MTAFPTINTAVLLKLREHLNIIHHVKGRIRLRCGPALWGIGARLDRERLQALLDQLQGIRNVRLNPAVASIAIEYDPAQIPPEDWETLLHGDAAAAGSLLDIWQERYAHLLSDPLMTKEQSSNGQ